MKTDAASRHVRHSHGALFAVLLALVVSSSASAFEAINGRLQAHGYFESQMRVMSADFVDQWDMTQWYNVFNLELEMDLVQDTHGPLDLMSAFIRIEARFDCIYSRGCGIVRGVDVYGDRARRMPRRLNAGDDVVTSGAIFIQNDGPYANSERDPLRLQETPAFKGIYESSEDGLGRVDREVQMVCSAYNGSGGSAWCDPAASNYTFGKIPVRFWNVDRNNRAKAIDSNMAIDDGTDGAPFLVTMWDFRDYRFSSLPIIGGQNLSNPLLAMGPWLPENYVETNATLASLPNPLDSSRVAPQSLTYGSGGNPFRPIPIYREDDVGSHTVYLNQESVLKQPNAPLPSDAQRLMVLNPLYGRFGDNREWANRSAQEWEARGIFVPSRPLARALAEDKFDEYPFNISELDRAFNRGQSQNDEGELKEAYLDIEMFDSRLWMRIGKQSIVWGKTELFRTTDQFNPQDFALATLPSLEESRINLWAIRGVWSFYEVGPLADVRLELAMNFDEFEPADLGSCGEPYAVNLVCALTFGSWVHGFTGLGVAGFDTPPDPWDDSTGIEFGGRLEWRWDRFSFAIADFYGYNDFPHPVRLSSYNRNVDWRSGRPRYYMHDVAEMANAALGCATPNGAGVTFQVNPETGGPLLVDEPTGIGTRMGYDGAANAGCITRGPSSRLIESIEAPDGNFYGVPFRAPVNGIQLRPDSNTLAFYAGSFLNDQFLADKNDPRFSYSAVMKDASGSPLDPTMLADPRLAWQEGPNAKYCETDPRLAGHPDCAAEQRGRRKYNETKFLVLAGEQVPNPDYNPFYDPRLDVYFDVGQIGTFPGGADFANYWNYIAEPVDDLGNPILAADPDNPVRFDPFRATEANSRFGTSWWMNAYDPDLQYDEQVNPVTGETFSRNALEAMPLNLSLFNWVCSTTVGFSDLDPSACALNVFSSTKKPAGGNTSTPRIATVISAFLSGSPGFNGFLGNVASDQLLSKGPLLPAILDASGSPQPMGMPFVQVDRDFEIPDGEQSKSVGLSAFRTADLRRDWADRINGYTDENGVPLQRYDPKFPWIYSREGESYNCLPPAWITASNSAATLCGGLAIDPRKPGGDPTNPNSFLQRYIVSGFVGKALTPEQEALIGCGPYFGVSCDGNGADLLWADVSAVLQSFLGSDSLGISFQKLGIADLVPESFGAMFMDNGSPSQEYRTDGRVLDRNGNLVRIDVDPDTLAPIGPALGSKGYIDTASTGRLGNRQRFVLTGATTIVPALDCNINSNPVVTAAGGIDQSQHRTSARCWDLRPYFRAYGVMPGTATFELLGIGGPKCTTGDIGGPLDPIGGVLPGCRNKWATIQYQPLDSWDGVSELHPNNPDAGYIGNNWIGQVMSWKLGPQDQFNPRRAMPSPRTDYRQWSSDPSNHVTDPVNGTDLANAIDCGTGTPASPGDPTDPQNYDCYLQNPSAGLPGLGRNASVRLDPTWASADPRYAAAVASRRSGLNWGVYDPVLAGCPNPSPNDPNCYVGGWRQTVDGEPDRMSLGDSGGTILYPSYNFATGNQVDRNLLGLDANGNPTASSRTFGSRVEGGCTPGSSWVLLQRTASGDLLRPPECAEVFRGASTLSSGAAIPTYLQGGTGHPFTGESFSSELAGVSWNTMMLLVGLSEDFLDGLASVRGFVNPELYESRYIYDEEWMWNPECGVTKSAEECGGRVFINDPTPPPIVAQNGFSHSVYGDPNRDLDGNPGRVRQVTGWRSTDIAVVANAQRSQSVPNPLPAGVQNKLQRDPRLPNIMTTFPDLLMYECRSANAALRANPQADLRTVWENCGTPANGGSNDWYRRPNGVYNQALRLGATNAGSEGLVVSMQWDYAFTGTENDLMAMIPYCENLEYSQRHFDSFGDDGNQPRPIMWGPNRIDCSEALNDDGSIKTLGRKRCTFITPQYCDVVQAIFSVGGQKRNVVQAGGNGVFGRRTGQWHSGSDIYLAYDKRNVLGFSMDFAEDWSKTNWGMEFTWIGGVPQINNNAYDITTDTDDFNLTISVDRPTFVNFLNANRTFFINSQWFFQYRKGWQEGMTNPGPWNVLATFAIFTGYFQDRLNPTMVVVYDFRSSSGGVLPQLNYRFSEAFSITIGASLFWGGQDLVVMPVNGIAPAIPRGGPNAYYDGTEPGLSLVRDRDEVFMTLRYTF